MATAAGALVAYGHFQHGHEHRRMAAAALGLQQGLLFVRPERANHGEGGNQLLVRCAIDGVPVTGQAVQMEIIAQQAF